MQSFQTDMQAIQGAIGSGDPDFAVFEIVGGTNNGFPSPGFTTLTQQSNGTFNVDSSVAVRRPAPFPAGLSPWLPVFSPSGLAIKH